MPLTSTQVEKVRAWLMEHIPSPACPACGKVAGFEVGDLVANPILTITQGQMAIDMDRGIPLVAVGCRHCGHVRFFAAQTIGLLPRDAADSPV